MGFGESFISGLGGSTASGLTGLITGGISQALGLSWSPGKECPRIKGDRRYSFATGFGGINHTSKRLGVRDLVSTPSIFHKMVRM